MTAPAFRTTRFWEQFQRRDGVFEIVRVERRVSQLVREVSREKGEGGTEREREQEPVKRKREGASGRESGLPLKHCSLLLLCGNSVFLFCLSVSSYCFILLSRLCHDPSGHLDLLAHLEKKGEML